MNDLTIFVFDSLEQARKDIVQNISATNKSASGKTAKSIRVVVAADRSSVIGQIYARAYFGALETGRKADKIPKNFTQTIREWIIAKNISISPIPYIRVPSDKWQPKYTPQERGLMAASGAIAHSIKEKGTKQFQLGPVETVYSNVLKSTTEKIKKQFKDIVDMEINSILR